MRIGHRSIHSTPTSSPHAALGLRRPPLRRHPGGLGVLGVVLFLLTGCFDFDGAWNTYCKTSDCINPVTDAGLGTNRDAGSSDAGDPSDAGGSYDAGDPSDAGGSSDAGAPSDAGSPSDAGGSSDAGGGSDGGGASCLGFGALCSVEGQCCETSDAGLPMACSRNNWCQDTARDCRNDGFTCSRDEQCCNGVCSGGRCALSAAPAEACENGRQCNPWYTTYSCAFDGGSVGTCTSARETGSSCASAAFCASGLCDATGDGGVFSASCQTPAGCTPLKQSPTEAGCCAGLVEVSDAGYGVAKCLLPDDAWCQYGSECASGDCYGYRCRSGQPSRGDRCHMTANCAGATNYCDPVNGICTNRWCLPPGLNAYAGCCAITSTHVCSFSDAGACYLPGFQTSTATQCCSGRTFSSGGTTYCDGVQFF